MSVRMALTKMTKRAIIKKALPVESSIFTAEARPHIEELTQIYLILNLALAPPIITW